MAMGWIIVLVVLFIIAVLLIWSSVQQIKKTAWHTILRNHGYWRQSVDFCPTVCPSLKDKSGACWTLAKCHYYGCDVKGRSFMTIHKCIACEQMIGYLEIPEELRK